MLWVNMDLDPVVDANKRRVFTVPVCFLTIVSKSGTKHPYIVMSELFRYSGGLTLRCQKLFTDYAEVSPEYE